LEIVGQKLFEQKNAIMQFENSNGSDLCQLCCHWLKGYKVGILSYDCMIEHWKESFGGVGIRKNP
jgi:hypothetical protein